MRLSPQKEGGGGVRLSPQKEGGGGVRLSPQKEGAGGGAFEPPEGGSGGWVGKRGSNCRAAVQRDSIGSEMGLQSGPDRKCSENLLPHETSLQMRSASWGAF